MIKMIDESHSFSPVLAMLLSLEKALLLKEIGGWCKHNQQNGTNIDEEGVAWVFMSVGSKKSLKPKKFSFSKTFPYMKERSIHRWLEQLESDNWIFTKTDNKLNYDKTKSYRLNIEKYNQEIIQETLRQNGESNRQNGESNRQNGAPIHPLTYSLKENNIKGPNFLNSVEASIELNKYLEEDKNVSNLNQAILKKFDSLEDARSFYMAIAEDFCTTGFPKYHYKFPDIDHMLPKFQKWAKNGKFKKTIAPKHRLANEFTEEEFLAAIQFLLKETKSPILKTLLVHLKMNTLLDFSEIMLVKIKNCGKFTKAEPLYMVDLIKIYLRYQNKKKQLREIFKDLSYAPKYKSVWNFVEKRRDFVT